MPYCQSRCFAGKGCGRAVHPLGAYCGLGLGTLMAAVWLAVPLLRETGMLGAIPCAGLSLLLQLFVREKPLAAQPEPATPIAPVTPEGPGKAEE